MSELLDVFSLYIFSNYKGVGINSKGGNGRRVNSVVEHSSTNPKVRGLIQARSCTEVMDYDEACFMHLTPGVVHNFPKAVAV